MDNIIKSARSYSGISDSAYDRNEDVKIEMIECDVCNGAGKLYFSCCGDDMPNSDSDICPTCKEHCGRESEPCEHCNGEGEIEI